MKVGRTVFTSPDRVFLSVRLGGWVTEEFEMFGDGVALSRCVESIRTDRTLSLAFAEWLHENADELTANHKACDAAFIHAVAEHIQARAAEDWRPAQLPRWA